MTILAERPVATVDTATEGAGARRLSKSYLRPDRVDLRTREDVPLSQDHAERLGRLFELHNARLVRYIAVRVGWDRLALAQDIVQEMWLELTMRPQDLDDQSLAADEALYPLLAFRAKRHIHQHLRLARNTREQVLGASAAGDDRTVADRLESLIADGADSTLCAVTELLDDSDEESLPWGGCYAPVIAALPERQREALELRCVEGMTMGAVAARMGCEISNVQTILKAALATLRNPQASARLLERREADRLPADYERVMARLPKAQRDVVILRVQGVPNAEIARRLGKGAPTTFQAYRRAVASLRLMVQERRMDPVAPAAPAQQATGCARKCETGCYLRRGAEVTA